MESVRVCERIFRIFREAVQISSVFRRVRCMQDSYEFGIGRTSINIGTMQRKKDILDGCVYKKGIHCQYNMASG